VNQRPVVALTRRLPGRVEAELGLRYATRLPHDDTAPSRVALATMLRECDAVVCTVTDSLPAALFESDPLRCRMLANFGAGVNHIDMAAARRAGIAVTNTPDQLTETTADLTLGLMMMTLRRLGEGERILRAGKWNGWRPTDFLGHDLHGRTLGLVGFGRIGQAVARRAALGFGMRVLAVGRRGPPTAPLPPYVTAAASLDALLGQAEIVSLHLPATTESRHLFDAARFGRMQPGSWFINTARGTLVDEVALMEAVRGGHLAGAGLDVFASEPRINPVLLDCPGLVLLPHMGSATVATREGMGFRVLANLDAFFAGEPLLDPVP
jgi:lactate dehydrogenase-like 2-hydroxyacid dehydrogenase